VDKNFYFSGTIFGLGWFTPINCDMSSHPEARMSFFHRVDQRRARSRSGLQIETEDRLSVGQSAVVIASLSALSWAVLISIVLALHAML
jgi:hypothetical protein